MTKKKSTKPSAAKQSSAKKKSVTKKTVVKKKKRAGKKIAAKKKGKQPHPPRYVETPDDKTLAKLREICLSLPDTLETITWGKPHFRVRSGKADKIFCGYGEENGVMTVGFKLDKAKAKVIVNDPRFWEAPYVGRHGWVSMDAAQIDDWDEVREYIEESFTLIAPQRAVTQMKSRGDT